MQINWVVLTYFVIGVFALSGFFRGWWKESITTGGLAFLFILLNNSPIAAELVNIVNSIITFVWSLAPNFFTNLFESMFDIIVTPGLAFQLDSSASETWIWALMLMVVFTTLVGRSLGPDAAKPIGRFLGALLGGFNGFLFLSLLREHLDGRFLPYGGTSINEIGGLASTGVAIQATNLPPHTAMDSLMPWIIIIISVLVFLAGLKTRVGMPKSKVRFWELDYRTPYGYNG
ncbi:hypothetical protein QUF63_00670 [Anaerolineales bacterium HSG25]|nr:hypothetical protein [Anaerolineales bacterium HSG25]